MEMKLTKIKKQVLQALWHKSRREFVPCTATDISVKTGIPEAKAANALGRLAVDGIVTKKIIDIWTVYDITEFGKEMVKK